MDKQISISEMNLGDVIRVFDGAWGDAMVKQANAAQITLTRPYMTHADFTFGEDNRVIPYHGFEEMVFLRTSTNRYDRVQRGANIR